MKIHFGGSGIGVKRISSNYFLIRKTLRKLDCILTRDWLGPEIKKNISSNEAKFEKTSKAINNADAVVLEGSYDTSSVGKQLMLALNLKLPTLILYYKKLDGKSSLDKFVNKDSVKLVKRMIYDETDIETKLDEFLGWAKNNTKMVRFNLEIERKLDNYLKGLAKQNKTSKSEEIRKLILNKFKDSKQK